MPPRARRERKGEGLLETVRLRVYGDPACYNAYFPRYLLKCLQDWFERYGDDLYGELKHIRNALHQVLASARFAARVRDDARQLDVLVATPIADLPDRDAPRQLLRFPQMREMGGALHPSAPTRQHTTNVVPEDSRQLNLF